MGRANADVAAHAKDNPYPASDGAAATHANLTATTAAHAAAPDGCAHLAASGAAHASAAAPAADRWRARRLGPVQGCEPGCHVRRGDSAGAAVRSYASSTTLIQMEGRQIICPVRYAKRGEDLWTRVSRSDNRVR